MKLKNDQRTIFGVGPKWLLWSLFLSLPVIIFALLTHPKYAIDSSTMLPFRVSGTLVLIVGFTFYVISVRTMVRAFNKNELVTTGVYSLSRNPIYTSLVFAIIPGFALFFGMPLLLLVSMIMYGVLKVKIKQEETELLDIFGEDYSNYRNRVNALFPINLFRTKQRISTQIDVGA